MDEDRKRAYQFLLCAAMLHLKWDLRFAYGPVPWWNPRLLRQALRQLKVAAFRSVAFHNLATFVASDMSGFDEEWFWRDIAKFQRDCPDASNTDYRTLFEKKLAGESVYPQFPLPGG
jgi:hypothetical protein